MSFVYGKRCGLIFDLDNTLIPTAKCYNNVMREVPCMLSEKYNLEIEIANKIMTTYNQLSSVDEPFWKQNNKTFFEWREYLLKKSVIHCTDIDIDIADLHNYYSTVFHRDILFSDKLRVMLKELRQQFKLAVLTNGDTELQRKKLASCEAEKYFDAIVVSYEHKMMKPDPRIFHIICRKIGLEHHQCVMIGDLLGTDVIGSKRAGLKGSVLVKGKDIHRLNEIQPDHIIDKIEDLKMVIDKFNWDH